jgi:hypothetical protein
MFTEMVTGAPGSEIVNTVAVTVEGAGAGQGSDSDLATLPIG